ncbi:MAG TPA: bacteriohemerythrin [Nitrospirota bacterium]|nr:bacteriohemerythrin [Nitrospirota bacterium]
MGFITWNDNYSVNISEVDEQHKRLIGLLNEMYDAMSVGKGRDVLGSVLKKLLDYTQYHFSTEERLFREHGYPESEAHKRKHNELTEKTKKLQESFDRGNKMITIDVMLFLSDWLNVHILDEDKRYSHFLNSKGVH